MAQKVASSRRRIKRRKLAHDRKEDVIQIRVTAEQRQKLKDAADRRGLDLSSWLRMVGLQAAAETEKQSS
jgi:uncharacterized protein (DUF1778 family)